MGQEIAVVLMNYGGPASLEDVRPYLKNIFSDRNILDFPRGLGWLRPLIASLIVNLRGNGSQEKYRMIGSRSPLLDETLKQAGALESILSEQYRVMVAMRYWYPSPVEIIKEIRKASISDVLLLPLFPQYTRSTVATCVEEFKRLSNGQDLSIQSIYGFHDHPTYIRAVADSMKEYLENNPLILFCAHSLPEKRILKGDPYLYQVKRSCELIIDELKYGDRWELVFQSRAGPGKWLGPDIGDRLIDLAKSDSRVPVLVYPISFVSEHLETRYDLDIKVKNLAEELEVNYRRVKTLGDDPNFIRALADLVRNAG